MNTVNPVHGNITREIGVKIVGIVIELVFFLPILLLKEKEQH